MILSLVLVNKTNKNLQNVQIEMFIDIDTKLAERPQPFNLVPRQIRTIKLMFTLNKTLDQPLIGHLTYTKPSGNTTQIIPFDSVPLNFDVGHLHPKQISEANFLAYLQKTRWECLCSRRLNLQTPCEAIMMIKRDLNLAITGKGVECEKDAEFLSANLSGETCFGTV